MNNIQKLKVSTGNTPYTTPIKAKVVLRSPTKKYMKDGQERSWTEVSLADPSGCIKAVVYDETKLPTMKEGANIMVRNFIYRDNTIIITKPSKTNLTGAVGEIPEEIETEARCLLNPPPAPFLKISEALKLTPETLVSLKGKIVRVEDIQMRKLQSQEMVPVRSIIIKDETGQARVSLWRDLTAAQMIQIGSYISLTNLKLNFYKEKYFNSLSTSQLVKEEVPIQMKNVTIDAFNKEDDLFTLVCFEIGTDVYEDFSCTRDILEDITLEGQDVLSSLKSMVPVDACVHYLPTGQDGNHVVQSLALL